ncbi:MAG TPA: aldo/keto reductase [Thermoanaerobaculia bacterium]|jgi:aryl-alcohol dehydrogenase-like predicted oxidoreductase|nr:aldo/keto reductase [Thermoanaerobaculia bacterium]
MEQRDFGRTGLRVPILGFGAGHIGDPALPEEEVGRLLHGALDLGVTLIDTARSYGLSEERIGRHLAGRRGEFVLSTKVGYGVPGVPDWTGPVITAGVDAALGRMRTDHIDVVHLHSCPVDVLERGDVVAALQGAVAAGKARVAAYSGDNAPLDWAIASGAFGSVELSVNLLDQRGIERALPAARERGLGVIAKRPAANAPWRFAERPAAQDIALYWDRWRALGLDPGSYDWTELALRFAAWQEGVACAIVGTSRLEHLQKNAELAAKGPLPPETVAAIRAAFRDRGAEWEGQI